MFAIDATEDGIGNFSASVPTSTPAGIYAFDAYRQAGESPAATDTWLGIGQLHWNGVEEIVSVNVTKIKNADANETLVAAVDASQTGLDLADGGRLDLILDEAAADAEAARAQIALVDARMPATPAATGDAMTLTANGLDAIAEPTLSGDPSTWSWLQKLSWIFRRFARAKKTSTTLEVYDSSGNVITTQVVSASGTTQTVGEIQEP